MKIFLPKNFEPQKPIKIYDYQDMMISLFSSLINPHQFNLEKLKEVGVIPLHWHLSKPVLSKPQLLQFCFQEGMTMTLERGKVCFFYKISNNSVNFSEVVIKFMSEFSNYNWQKIQIIIRRLISLPGNSNNGEKFMQKTLLNSEKWDILGIKPRKVKISFFYPLLENPLFINITDIQGKNNKVNKIKSGLLFKGIFNYQYHNQLKVNKLTYFNSILNNISHNLDIFNQIIDENILS